MIEAQVLPLIAALQSRIDQAHFIRIVAERLRVPEEAVRAEVAKRPVLPNTEDMVSTHVPQALVATPIERKVGMLFFILTRPLHKGNGCLNSLEQIDSQKYKQYWLTRQSDYVLILKEKWGNTQQRRLLLMTYLET